MKKTIFISVIIILLILKTVSAEHLNFYQEIDRLDTISCIERLNYQILVERISESQSKYHLIIIYTDWCKPCSEAIEIVNANFSTLPDLSIYYVYPDKLKNITLISKYLKKHGVYRQTYILDESYSGNVKKRFIKFRNELCTGCDEILGFPSVILLNDSKDVLYMHTGSINVGDIRDQLK